MDKKVSSAIARLFRSLRSVRGGNYAVISLYEAELKGALSVLSDLRLIDLGEWMRLTCLASKQAFRARGFPWSQVREYNPFGASEVSSAKAVQHESASEQVSASEASSRLSVRGVLVPRTASGKVEKPLLTINFLSDEDGDIVLDRTAFPRLGKHWAPSSVLVGYQERKGHAVCRP